MFLFSKICCNFISNSYQLMKISRLQVFIKIFQRDIAQKWEGLSQEMIMGQLSIMSNPYI